MIKCEKYIFWGKKKKFSKLQPPRKRYTCCASGLPLTPPVATSLRFLLFLISFPCPVTLPLINLQFVIGCQSFKVASGESPEEFPQSLEKILLALLRVGRKCLASCNYQLKGWCLYHIGDACFWMETNVKSYYVRKWETRSGVIPRENFFLWSSVLFHSIMFSTGELVRSWYFPVKLRDYINDTYCWFLRL